MNIYIGNLAHDVTDDDLKEAFEVYGKLISVNVIKNKRNGDHRGFGFVEMLSEEESKLAIEGLNGKEFKGKSLIVNEAHARSENRTGGVQ